MRAAARIHRILLRWLVPSLGPDYLLEASAAFQALSKEAWEEGTRALLRFWTREARPSTIPDEPLEAFAVEVRYTTDERNQKACRTTPSYPLAAPFPAQLDRALIATGTRARSGGHGRTAV